MMTALASRAHNTELQLVKPTPSCRDDEDMPSRAYTRRGECVRHPQIQLRRRTALGRALGPLAALGSLAGGAGGWTVLRERCPLCAMGVPPVGAKSKIVSVTKPTKRATGGEGCTVLVAEGDRFERARVKPSSKPDDATAGEGEELRRSSSCGSTASLSNEGSFNDSFSSSGQSHDSGASGRGSSRGSRAPSRAEEDHEANTVVCGMPYRYARHSGSYTGQVDPRSRLPHGMGTWRSASLHRTGHNQKGLLLEGEWIHGHLYYKPQRHDVSLKGEPTGNGDSMLKHGLENIAEYGEDPPAGAARPCRPDGGREGEGRWARDQEEEEGEPSSEALVRRPPAQGAPYDVVVARKTVHQVSYRVASAARRRQESSSSSVERIAVRHFRQERNKPSSATARPPRPFPGAMSPRKTVRFDESGRGRSALAQEAVADAADAADGEVNLRSDRSLVDSVRSLAVVDDASDVEDEDSADEGAEGVDGEAPRRDRTFATSLRAETATYTAREQKEMSLVGRTLEVTSRRKEMVPAEEQQEGGDGERKVAFSFPLCQPCDR